MGLNIMPTAAKAVAALSLGATGFALSSVVKAQMTDITNWGWFTAVNMAIGAFCGWIMIGRRVGRGTSFIVSAGLSASVMMVIWALFIQSGNEALRLALRRRYDGMFEFIAGLLEHMVDWGLALMTVEFWVVMLLGGIISGVLSEIANRHWN